SAPVKKRKRGPIRWHDEWTQFRALMRRSFISKLRNRANIWITTCAAPVLALLIGSLLRYSESGKYDFASAFHIPTYLFLGLLVAMFLSLTNSADDIIRDRPTLQRERNLDVRLPYYIFAKMSSLSVFALIQCVLFVFQFIPMRWSYEEVIVAQSKLNPLTSRQERSQREIDSIVAKHRQDVAEGKRLDELKEVLAFLSGLEAKSPDELDHYLKQVDQVLDRKRSFDSAAFKNAKGTITAEQVYVNQKVSDLISNAEMEQSDYRRGSRPNVFFGAEKRYLGVKISVFVFNTIVLIGSTFGLLGLLYWIL